MYLNNIRKINILSIDGGGIKGIIPSIILEYIEDKLIEKTRIPNIKIANYFDCIGGTNSGSLLTTLLLLRDSNGNLVYSAKDIKYIMLHEFPKVYEKKKSWRSILSNDKINSKTTHLYKFLEDLFQDKQFCNLRENGLLLAFDETHKKTNFFNSIDTKKKKRNYWLKDLLYACLATPGWFPPASIAPLGTNNYSELSDAGFNCNCPLPFVYAEGSKIEDAHIVGILSLGSGTIKGSLKNEIQSGISEEVAYAFEKTLSHFSQNYLRIQPTFNNEPPYHQIGFTEKKHIDMLEYLALEIIQTKKKDLDLFIDSIIENRHTTREQIA